jgi:tetratricopeptide (TPR) repeat protein/transglutaminase-like putative cysteine protease
VLVKVSGAEEGVRFALRLTKPDGAPLGGLKWSSQAQPGAAPISRAVPRVHDVLADLRARVRSAPQDAGALEALATYLHFVAPVDPTANEAITLVERATRLAPTPARFKLEAQLQNDPNAQRRALERAVELAPAGSQLRAALLAELGQSLIKARREEQGLRLLEQARTIDANQVVAALELAKVADDRGLPARAAQIIDEAVKAHTCLAVLRARAELEHRTGKRDLAERHFRELAAQAPDDLDVLGRLQSLARSRGDVAAALEVLDRVARLTSDQIRIALDRAAIFEGAGRVDEAERAIAAALLVVPDDARLHEARGRIMRRLGPSRAEEARRELEHSLELRPQNPELRAYLMESFPSKNGASSLAREFGTDVDALVASVRAAKPNPRDAGESGRVLLDSRVVRVHPNGLSESYHQRVVHVLDARGARELDEFGVRYTPDTQTVEIRSARMYKARGGTVQANISGDQDVSEPWYGMYYDVRARGVRFPSVEPGDILSVEYVVSDVGRRNVFADYFGDLHFLQEERPRSISRLVIIAPAQRPLHFNEPALPGLTLHKEPRGADVVYRFEAFDVPKIELESGMPGFSEVAAYVHASTFASWADVASFYRGLVEEQLQSSPAIRQAALEAVHGITDELARIRAIQTLVVKRTRYVALEFGVYGYKPYKVSQIFQRKFGDCKDKAALLVVMLREIGVDATLALVRTRRGGDIAAAPASLAAFDHAIAYVPKHDLFLDGTAEFSGAEELPAQDQGVAVLLVTTGRLVRTPILAAAKNRITTERRAVLDENGAAQVSEHVTVAGESAHEWRSYYQTEGERLERYGKSWNGIQPGAQLEKVEMAHLDDLSRTVEVAAEVRAPRWARRDGARLVTSGLGRELDLLRTYARLSSRKFDLVLAYPWSHVERVVTAPPAGYRVTQRPAPCHLATPFGKYDLDVAVKPDGALVITAALEVSRQRITRGDYEAFRSFLRTIDESVAQDVVIER